MRTMSRDQSSASRFTLRTAAPLTAIAAEKSWSAATGLENVSTISVPPCRVAAERNSGGVASAPSSITYTCILATL